MIGVTILGSTGSIGLSTLDVIARNPEHFRVVALTANSSDKRLAEQCIKWRPEFAVMVDADATERLQQRLKHAGLPTTVLTGIEGLQQVAALPQVGYVMAAIVGAAGLLPTLAAARAGKRVLLANKEALVMSGQLLIDAISEHGGQLLPIDSEHNAIFQAMPPHHADGLDQVGVRRILLTGSGGPFRTRPLDSFDKILPSEACAHPNWKMGRKISVDSATMMNKGLELIEACWLFATGPERIEVLIHPQSVIHSMVEYCDGSVLAQLGNPDMRTPIAHAMAWPERIEAGVAALDLVEIAKLSFEAPDTGRFPCLRLGFEAAQAGGTASVHLNAANEIAVAAFLKEKLPFTDIPRVIEHTLEAHSVAPVHDIDTVLAADHAARITATAYIAALS